MTDRVERIRQACIDAHRALGYGRGERLDHSSDERVRLSDILVAISMGRIPFNVSVRTGGQIWVNEVWTMASWDLGRDNLDKQHEETISVIESLI